MVPDPDAVLLARPRAGDERALSDLHERRQEALACVDQVLEVRPGERWLLEHRARIEKQLASTK